jgi:hypothetical protein
MKVIGLIGGMSWESSIKYYELVNTEVRKQLGGLNSAECVMYSVNFAEIEQMQKEGRWDEAGEVLANVAKRLEKAGAEIIVLCTNTMHKLAAHIQEAVPELRFLHIASATATAVKARGMKTIGLLGTIYTMEQGKPCPSPTGSTRRRQRWHSRHRPATHAHSLLQREAARGRTGGPGARRCRRPKNGERVACSLARCVCVCVWVSAGLRVFSHVDRSYRSSRPARRARRTRRTRTRR